MAQRFKELAEERFPGRVRVEVYPSAQLMEDTESIEALAFGEVQMIATSLSLYRPAHAEVPGVRSAVPVPEPRRRRALSAERRPGASCSTRSASTASRASQFWHNGMKQFSGPRPLDRARTMRAGLKFRVMESDILQAQIEAIGGSPQKMAFGEVYQALQTGTVDAQENTWSNIYSSKFYEVQPYITESNHGYIGYFVAVNAAFWQSLPDDLRAGLEATLAEVTAVGQRALRSDQHRGPAAHRRLGPLRDHGADARAARGVAGRDAARLGRVPRRDRRRSRRRGACGSAQ